MRERIVMRWEKGPAGSNEEKKAVTKKKENRNTKGIVTSPVPAVDKLRYINLSRYS